MSDARVSLPCGLLDVRLPGGLLALGYGILHVHAGDKPGLADDLRLPPHHGRDRERMDAQPQRTSKN